MNQGVIKMSEKNANIEIEKFEIEKGNVQVQTFSERFTLNSLQSGTWYLIKYQNEHFFVHAILGIDKTCYKEPLSADHLRSYLWSKIPKSKLELFQFDQRGISGIKLSRSNHPLVLSIVKHS
jgi:hypothetical protein